MIQTWPKLDQSEQKKCKDDLREIFFISSVRQQFDNLEEKEKFWHRWTDYYFLNCADLIFLNIVEKKLVGYLMGCSDSQGAESKLNQDISYFSLFSDFFLKYPAHLHINLHPDSRGKGFGSELITAYDQELQNRNCAGAHLITDPSSRNVKFYRQNGFAFEQVRHWRNQPLLFMGKTF